MRPQLLPLLFLLVQSSGLFSQAENLVNNPSFERRIDFRHTTEENNWTKCLKNDTPDYIGFSDRGEPDFYFRKYIGGLLPYEGEAYVGIFCYRIHPFQGIKEVREFIQVPLKKKLQKDTLYNVGLYIALDPESNIAINNINVAFAREPMAKKREKEMYELYPRVRFKRSFYDSTTWMKLESRYKAKGYESHIIIGNLANDNSTGKNSVCFESDMQEKWSLHELERVAYYYIDMVSLVKTSEIIAFKDKPKTLSEPKPSSGETWSDTSIIEIARVKPDSSIVLNHIFFNFNESLLLPESYKELDRLFEQLQQYRDFSIVIEGHTDHLGTFEYNIQLSLDRAQAVAGYLLRKGLTEERISYEGLGYTRPLSDNRTENGRKMNRRVAFRITGSIKQQ